MKEVVSVVCSCVVCNSRDGCVQCHIAGVCLEDGVQTWSSVQQNGSVQCHSDISMYAQGTFSESLLVRNVI